MCKYKGSAFTWCLHRVYKSGTSRCGQKWQPSNGTPGSSHTNPTVSAVLHQGEACLSGRCQSSPCQWGRAQQVFCPGDLLGFEHHPLAAKQSKALVPELMVT